MKPITAEIMAEIDRRAQQEYGIPQSVLMESAGRSVAETILEDLSSPESESVAIFCGKGNNGGDGFVVARYLAQEGSVGKLTVYAPAEDVIRRGAAYDNFKRLREMNLDVRPINEFAPGVEKITIAVDSVFGTGFKGELPEAIASIARHVNSKGVRVYAVDVPSGLDATTGEASKDCFRADKTVTFGLPKKGFYEKTGPEVSGSILVKDIGFPEELLSPYM